LAGRGDCRSLKLPAALALGVAAILAAAAGAGAAALQINGTVTAIASLNVPASVIAVANNDQTVYVADATAHEVLALAVATDHVSVFAGNGTAGDSGDGGSALAAELNDPTALDIDAWGNVVILDQGAQAFRVVAQQSCSGNCPYGLRGMTSGDIYTIAGDGTQGSTRPANGSLASTTALEPLFSYGWTGVDAFGDLLVYSAYSNRDVFVVAGASCPSASLATCPYGFSAMTAGDIYWVAGNDFAGNPSAGNSGNGGPATAAEFESPVGFAVDSHRDILVADGGTDEVRLIAGYACASSCAFGLGATAAGDVYSLAAFPGDPEQLYLDHAGNLIVADPLNFNVGVIAAASCSSSCPYGLGTMSAGHLYTLEGPNASSARVQGLLAHAAAATIGEPAGLAFDPSANLFIADESSKTLDEIQMQAPTSSATPPPPGTAPPRIAIDSFRLARSRHSATVRLTCSAAVCTGTVALTAELKVKVLHHTRRESFQLGHASYTLSAGASVSVKLKLTSLAHAAIAKASKRHPLHSTLAATVTGGRTATRSLHIA
jgi:hypothetical protein